MKKLNLAGQRLGRLLVLNEYPTKSGDIKWMCLCSCGTICITRTSDLRSGNTKSCGCLQVDRNKEALHKDLTGMKFGRLIAKEYLSDIKPLKWRCECECGNVVDVNVSNLTTGNTQSCGCYKREQIQKANTGQNCKWWKGGISSLVVAIRSNSKYLKWRLDVFKKNHYTCQYCGYRGAKINAHHIKPLSSILEEFNIKSLDDTINCEELWNIKNGITLCKQCHYNLHMRGDK